MSINYSSKDSDETRNIHTKSNNIEILMGSQTSNIIEELFESLSQRRISRRIVRINERK